MFKIAIVGASTLLGKELKEVIDDSPLAGAHLTLLDGAEGQGQLEQVGDEISLIQPIEPGVFDGIDFTFFCGGEELTVLYWRDALRAGSTVLDLTGALDGEQAVVVRAPWTGAESATVDLLTPAVIPAHPAALALTMLLERLAQSAPVRTAEATVLLPASEFGRAAMDELHQQTISLLSFQNLDRAVYDAQAAFNLLAGAGESSKVRLSAVEAHLRRHLAALSANRWPQVCVQLVAAPVFHGLTLSVAIELEHAVDVAGLEEVFGGDRIDLVLEDTDSPSNLAVTGQNELLVRMRPEFGTRGQGQVSRLWLWVAADNLRIHAQNALECALDLRKLRPQGPVQ